MPCAPRTQRRELTVLQKGKILGLLEANASYAEIARQTTLHKNTIRNFCERYRTRGNHENLKRSGAPRLTTEAQDRKLSAAALADTRLKHIQVKEQINSDHSLPSIRR